MALALPARAEIASGTLRIQGVALEIETSAITTGADIPTSVQTIFAGKKNDEAPVVDELVAIGELTGPGLDAPVQLTTAPGHRFQIPGFAQRGVYALQNIRLMKGGELLMYATPPVATITVADLLQTEVTVRQLTPDELRARGINVDSSWTTYEYSFTFVVGGERVIVPYVVAIDPATHQVTPIRAETPFSLPPVRTVQPPRWTPPDIIPFEFPRDPEAPDEGEQGSSDRDETPRVQRPSIPAALVIPNSLAVLHQFFGVIIAVTNGAPSGSTARIEDLSATISVPSGLRSVRSSPPVAFGQPVPIVDAANNVTFLVAQARGEAEWTIEGLAPGTHTIEADINATYRENGQQPVPLRARPRATIVVHDARFNINFSHPDTVRQGITYSTYTFVTNTSPAQQTIRVSNGLPSCEQNPSANVCRLRGAESDELTLASGEMRMIEYSLRPNVTGRVFATAGTIDSDALTAAAQLHMGVSETGIPLSPATLVLPHYAQFLPQPLVSAQLGLLGLGYSIATAPVTQATARFPRVIKTDVFYRAADIARAGQRVFIADDDAATKVSALANLTLDLLGNAVELREWDQLRRELPSGRVAGAAVAAELAAAPISTAGEFVDAFAAATAHRLPYLLALSTQPSSIAIRSLSGTVAGVANEAGSGWKRSLPFADISRWRTGEIGFVGRWGGNVELMVRPETSGPLSVELIFPKSEAGGLRRAHLDLNGAAGEAIRIPIAIGTNIEAFAANGSVIATAVASDVAPPTLRAVAARQDLYLDPEGHKVSVLFSRPVALETNGIAREKFHPAIAFDRDGVAFTGPRPIFAAALQDSGDIANLSFDHVLTTNAAYTIAIDPLVDPVANSVVSFAPLTPKIDNERPAGIIYGRFLKGDNTPITNAEVRLFSGHHRGCLFGLFGDEPPLDCNPYREPPQYAATDGSGAYLFEYVPRDPIADFQLDGGYRLLGVNADGRFTIVDGTVRRPGVVHFVNLQLLGRGAAEGVVRYEDGARVAGAEVFVANTMFSTGRRTRTDASGSFRIDDLPVGPITFGASDARGNTAFAASEIATPGQVAGIDLTIVRQPFPGVGAIRGRVVRSDDGRPVGGARVGVSTQGFGLDETLTDAEGRYEFRRVPAGFVTVLAANWSIAGEAAHADFDLRADETVEVPPLILPIRTAEDPVTAVDGVVLREDPLHPGDPSFYQPVRGAVIAIGSREPIFSDTTGRFTLAAVPIRYGGIVEVRAYDPETRRNAALRLPTLSEGGPNNVAIFIPARAFGAGLIRVRLLSAYGAPVSGFRVIVPGLPPMRLEETGGGLYELRNVRIGAPVTIFAAGGPAAYGDQFAVGTAQVTYPGQTITLTLRLPGDGTVRVRLRSDIDLIGEVALSYPAWDEAEQSPAIKTRTVSTSVDGAASWATFADVPALGDYKIVSLHPVHGYATAAGRLMYDGDLADHVLRMSRLSTVRGTLYAIDGVTPIGGATVRLSDGRRDAGALLTASDGTFAFHDVPAGISFRVIAEATQSGIYRTGIAYGTTPDGGGPVEGVSVVLRTRGVVEGRVVYRDYKVFDPRNAANNVADDTPGVLSDNAPVATAKFWLRELSFPDRAFGNDASPLVTDLAGNFVVSNVFTGPLRARAWDASNPDVQGSWSGELSAEGGTLSGERAIIAIGDGGVATINVTVVDPNQALLPVANAEVSLHAGRLFDFATTDGTGVARFHGVPVGTYSVSAFSKSLGRSGGSASFAIGRDDVREVRVLLEFSGRVTGTLTDPESAPAGAPVRGAAVTLTGNNYQTRASTTVDGAFEFGGVREGMFALDAKDTRTNRRARATRNLSAADPQPHVNLFLEATESLHVAVYLPNDTGGNSGVLAPPVEVTATQRNSDYVRTLTGNPVVLPSLFRDQPYEVAVREIGGQRRQFKASHSFPNGSAATPLTFVYPATGTVEVLVRRSDAPASSARVRIRSGAAAMDFFTGADGLATATSMPLGIIGVQATTIDGTFSASASGSLTHSSAPLRLVLDLGAFAGISGVVEAEAGGPSQGTRVIATFASRTLETLTDADGRYGFTGIPSLPVATTTVDMVYLGPDGVTIGARQTATITSAHASQTVSLPPVRLDATPPQLVAVSPVDGSVEVPPDTFIRFAFSEPIAPALISNAHFTLIAADGSGALISAFDPPFVDREGRTVITMRPPPAVPFPLRSNTLYRVFVSGEVTDRSGHRLGAPRSIAFTTSDYTEPRLISRIPAAGIPASRAQSFEFRFSEAIESGAIVRLFKIDVPGGSAIVELAGDSFIDPSNAARLMFAARDPLQPESYYRILLSGVHDLQGNAVAPQSFEYASFDERRPFVNFLSPVAGGTPLVSGVEYTLGVDVRNVTPDGTAATDLASVEWFQAGTSSDMFLRRETAPPFSYRFVAPEAPSGGLSYSLRALATDLSGNVSEPATITFTVQPNVAPANVSVTVAPQSAYPGSVVTARVTFDDEGIVATVATKLRATRGSTEYLETKTRSVTRSTVTSLWPAVEFVFALPPDLRVDAPATIEAAVTDVRGLSNSASNTLTLLVDHVAPAILSLLPAAETRLEYGAQYRAQIVVSDGETGVASVRFVIDGVTHLIPASASTTGPEPGTRLFSTPVITVPAKNVDTRVSVDATVTDYNGNATSRRVEVIYVGVNDPTIPKAAWICPVDRAALPAATLMTVPLRVRATDDIAITGVQFVVPGIANPIAASRVGTTDVYVATATVTTPAAGNSFVIVAQVSDADPLHTLQMPISIGIVAADFVIEATQAITSANVAQYENRSIVVRTTAGLLVPHVPVTVANLLVLDGGRVEALPSTTTTEHRVDITVTDHLYVSCDSSIDVSARGYLGGWGSNADGSNTRNDSAIGRTDGNVNAGGAARSGASHGGLGQIFAGGIANVAYGSIKEPRALGSGGGGAEACCGAGGVGGGAVALRASTFAIAGSVRADGGAGYSGGSGGSVLISAGTLVAGDAAVIAANGASSPAAGGGGRVAISAANRIDLASPFNVLQSRGGSGNANLAAAPGTIWLQRPGQQDGELLIAAKSTAAVRATPLAGALDFDNVILREGALARFDGSVTIAGTTDVDATSVLMLPSHTVSGSVTTTPAPGSSLIRASDLDVLLNASSIAGITDVAWNLSAAAPRAENPAGHPTSVVNRATRIAVPSDAPLGAATLTVRVTDRADRFVDLPALTFNVVDNAPPAISTFTVVPAALYPGGSMIATVVASDDLRITKLGVTSTIGSGTPIVQSVSPNVATATHSFSVPIPITTRGGTAMTIEAAVEDGFPSRGASKETKSVAILVDTNAPSVSISEPGNGAIVDEASGATIVVRAAAVDAEVGIATISAQLGDALPVPMTLDSGSWRAVVPVPPVDGTAPVPLMMRVTAADYEGNASTASVGVLVRPLIDPNAPSLRWTCGARDALFPASTPMKLRVFAKGVTAANGVQRVDFFVGSDSSPLSGAPVSGVADHYEATWTTPDLPEGTSVDIRAVAVSVAGNRSDLSTSVTIVKSAIAPITASQTIDASNAATYANQTVVVQSGTVTIVGEHSWQRLIVAGGNVTHPAGGSNALQINTTGAVYVACGGSIDVTGRGYAPVSTYPGATVSTQPSAGSHIGRGGTAGGTSGSTFGSVARPREAGASGGNSNTTSGGGVIRINAAALVVEGAIRANGGTASISAGGGSVWIATATISGTGSIEANGATGSTASGGGGAIAVEYASGTLPQLQARGGGSGTQNRNGAAGTVYIKGPGATYGSVVIDNAGVAGSARTELPSLGSGTAQGGTGGATLVTDRTANIPSFFEGHRIEIRRAGSLIGTWRVATINARTVTLAPNGSESINVQPGDQWQGVYRFDTLSAPNGEPLSSADPIRLGANDNVEINGPTAAGHYLELEHPVIGTNITIRGNVAVPAIRATTVNVESGASLTSRRANPATLTIDASTVHVKSGAAIDVTGRGYAPVSTYPGASLSTQPSAGSHIGRGGSAGGTSGSTFGSVYRPVESGASGGNSNTIAGGGVVRIVSDALVVDGAIRADGGAASLAGAGGSVWITTILLSGAGTIAATGGAGSTANGGGGAIAIEYANGSMPSLNARGGGSASSGRNGAAGSIFVKAPGAIHGSMIIDNAGVTGSRTELPYLGSGVAQAGTAGAVLVTDRTVDIPPYFAQHWVEISRGGALLGTWRIAAINARTVTLAPNGNEAIDVRPGDQWTGAYRLDMLTLRSTRLYTPDPLRVTAPIDKDAASVIEP